MAACAETPPKKKSENRRLGVYRSPTPPPGKKNSKGAELRPSIEASNEFGNFYSSYLWTFKNFSKCILTKTEEMTAPIFKFAGSRWAVGVNLYKVSSGNNFTVVVGLDKTTSDMKDGRVRWSVSLVDRYGVGRRRKEGSLSIAKAKSWEVFSFKRNSLLEEHDNVFLPNDCLAIRLDLLVEDLFPCQQSWGKNRGYELLKSESSCVSLSNDLLDLLRTGKDSDIIVKAGESQFPCHKLILSCRSEVFSKAIRELQAGNDLISIDDIEHSDVQPLLDYIYSGILCSDLPIERICSIYTSANKYGVGHLKECCRKQMINRMEKNTVLQILLLAQKYFDTLLKASAADYLIFNEHIFLTEDWIKFSNISDNYNLALEILNGYIRKSLVKPDEISEEEETTATASMESN